MGWLAKSTAALALMLVSVLLTLLMLEAGLRLVDGVGFGARNWVAARISLLAKAYPTAYDPLLGFIPRPDYRSDDNAWHTLVSIDHRGLRYNGPGAPPATAPVLAVGDSYTFGDEVSDDSSWPALLQTMIGDSVINGGVFSYGLDQAILRAERLIPELGTRTLVISLIYGDVRRSEVAQRLGVEKPYFTLEGDGLKLNNVPPSRNRPRVEQMGWLRLVLGYSYLADWLMRRLGHEQWWYADGYPQIYAHHDGPEVACRLLGRLKAFTDAHDVRVYAVGQYFTRDFADPDHPKSIEDVKGTGPLLACARQQGFVVIDTFEAFQNLVEHDRPRFNSMLAGAHLSLEGNRLVARMIADAMLADGYRPVEAEAKP